MAKDAFAVGQPGRAIIDLLTRNSRQFKSVEDCLRVGRCTEAL
jgi:hypothetical protein